MKKTDLHNRYFLLRHGHSEANQKGIIVSNPTIGIGKYGLTELGIRQVFSASEYFKEEDNIIIYSSDFKRAKETAEIIQKNLSVDDIQFTPLLRERFFGLHDGLDDKQYATVWDKDMCNENNCEDSVESPRQVADRTTSLILTIEGEYRNRNILLVSHGDCLQILQTVLEDISPAIHRSLKHLQTAEVRNI